MYRYSVALSYIYMYNMPHMNPLCKLLTYNRRPNNYMYLLIEPQGYVAHGPFSRNTYKSRKEHKS